MAKAKTDPTDIACCIVEVLENPGRLDSLRERSRVRVRMFTWERVAERTLEGYQRSLHTAPSPTAAR
mgnify:CR=1 FL=1